MSIYAIVLISISALLHAAWNFTVKRHSPTASFFLVANGAGAWIFLPWVILNPGILRDLPDGVWGHLTLTGFFMAIYCTALAASYRRGDLSLSYPLARSLPVVIVPVISIILGRGELLGGWFAAGAVLILAGGALISLEELQTFRTGRSSGRRGAFPMAVLAALGTAGYSVVDDSALRIARSALGASYGTLPVTLVYSFLEALFCAGWIGIFLLPGKKKAGSSPLPIGRAAAAGVVMYLTYGMVLLSLAHARDISLVVAFRQIGVLIGALMGMLFLRESAFPSKILGLAVLFTGLVLVALN